MTDYKAICTVTWKFSSDLSHADCLSRAKSQLKTILNASPEGEDFDGFLVQVDLAEMKERKRLVHLGTFDFDEVFPYITQSETKREYKVRDDTYLVRMNSDRYHLFKQNTRCVVCGITGTKLVLDLNPGDQSPHFNLYAEEHGRLVLMTKDHIVPKSNGGRDELNNYRTMCCVCNNLRAAYDLSLDDCRELRHLYGNPENLPRKELRALINKRREEMSRHTEEETDEHERQYPLEDSASLTDLSCTTGND